MPSSANESKKKQRRPQSPSSSVSSETTRRVEQHTSPTTVARIASKSPSGRLRSKSGRVLGPGIIAGGTTVPEKSGTLGRAQSEASLGSVGMGVVGGVRPRPPNALPKPIPEGSEGNEDGHSVYDCIVYLFYCATHDHFAVTNREYSSVVWLPFVVLRSGMTNTRAALDQMALFLGRREAEADGDQTFLKMPRFSANQFIHVLHVLMPTFDQNYHRFAYFVQIDPTEGYQCCQRSVRLQWIPTADILQDRVACLWGAEVKQFISLLIKPSLVFIQEFGRDDALALFADKTNSFQTRMLTTSKVSRDTVLALFEDYVHHCFPSILMCYESFRCYLIKYGFAPDEPRLPWLFSAFDYDRKGYIEFNEFLLGLIALEPTTEHTEGRIRFVFRYFDVNANGELTLDEFLSLLHDTNPKASVEQLHDQLETFRSSDFVRNDRVPYESFYRAVQSGKLRGTGQMCRAPRPIVAKVVSNHKTQQLAQLNRTPSKSKLASVLRTKAKGVCCACRTSNPDFALHTVYLDSMGTCQKPLRLRDVPASRADAPITAIRYSAEFVFLVESPYRFIIDLVRANHNRADQTGLMTTAEEVSQFLDYIRNLTANVAELLSTEERLIRTNSPAVVVGDLQGNLDSLMALEGALWPSVPVMQYSLVLLGNYTDDGNTVDGTATPTKFNVEVVCYLLALKMLAPNKVFLLRGANEIRERNRATLLVDCEQRYGSKLGNFIWSSLNEALDRLPIAAVIDESVLCVHSGVPKTHCLLPQLYAIPESMQCVLRESPLAYEFIFNSPSGEEQSHTERVVGSTQSLSELRPGGQFSVANFGNFMRTNGLSFLIRGSDQLAEGYRLHFGARIITISSAIEPTVAIVDRTEVAIRLVQVTNADSQPSE